MKKHYKFKEGEHGDLVETFIDFCEDFDKLASSNRWRGKDQLKHYEDLKRCHAIFKEFEEAFIRDWNGSDYPFTFSESWFDLRYMLQEISEDGKITLDKVLDSLTYHLCWYDDRMNQNRLLILHCLFNLALDLANDFSEEIDK